MGTRMPRRINLLWVLAALLGAAAVHAAFRVIHHPEPSTAIMSHLAEVSARFAASEAEGKLQALAREELEPGARRPGSLRPLESFQFDPVDHPGKAPLTLHFDADEKGNPRATLTDLQYDSSGAPTRGTGLVFDGRQLGKELFGSDSLYDARATLEVATVSGIPLYRSRGPAEPYSGTIIPPGVLGELAITSGLASASGMFTSINAISRDQLWWSGVLLLSAVLVIVIAAASSRREALLARARSDFIAGVSHELRMPLAQILLASETLAMEREPDSQRQLGLATSIVREARRLAGLVDNVLLVARSGAVTLSPSAGPVAVNELFAEVEEAVQLALEDEGQRLEVRPAPGLGVRGDRQLLRQALGNLVDNARKYGAAGQTIRLGAEPVGDEAHLYVENDGPGIPAAERARLFLPYERLDRDQTSERTGSGLGLAVVAQIARASGGRVWLEDGRAGGTRAVLALKAAETP